MDEAVKFPKNRQLEAIKTACLKNAPCKIVFEEKPKQPVTSTFLYTDRPQAGSQRRLYIAFTPDAPKSIHQSRAEIRFEYDDLSLVFYTTFQRSVKWKSKLGEELDAWEIRYPGSILVLQRRGYFRVRANAKDPVKIGITFAEDQEQKTKRSQRKSKKSRLKSKKQVDGIEGILWDISGGGLSFTFTTEPPFQFTPGAEIQMSLALPGLINAVELMGRIVARKLNIEGQTVYALAYSDIDSTLKLRRGHNQILRFIASREREILSNLRQKKRWNRT